MKHLKTILFLCGIIVVDIVFSCTKDETPLSKKHLNEPFSIKLIEKQLLTPYDAENSSSDSCLSVSFEKVVYDSRCPKESCHLCYGSTAQIQVLLSHRNKQSRVNLIILGCQDEYECNDQLYYRKDTLGYRICLLRLDPYPTSSGSVDFNNYIAKLNISKL